MSPKKGTAPLLGDDQHFNATLGRALTWWQHVETALGDVFCAFMGSVNHQAARRAFNAVVAFNARLSMTHAAATAAISGTPLLAEWEVLHSKAGKKSEIRNRLVHFHTFRNKAPSGEEVIELMPSFYDPKWI